MPIKQNEAQVQLALQAIERDQKLSIRQAAKLFGVARITIYERRKGIRPRTETLPNNRNLDPIEEQVIVRRVLDLYEQGFAPAYSVVEDMANLLRETRGAKRVGKH